MLIEIGELASGKFGRNPEVVEPYSGITVEDFEQFQKLLLCDNQIDEAFKLTESPNELFGAFELLKVAVPKAKQEDLFFAYKLGYFFEGVPMKLVYLLDKALKVHDTPNVALNSIEERTLKPYLVKGLLPEGITVKTIMENLLGKPIELLSKSKRKAVTDEVVEIFVENTNRVLVVNKDIGDLIDSREDLLAVEYKEGVGVVLHDMPIRTINSMVGLTFNDYDLRDCK